MIKITLLIFYILLTSCSGGSDLDKIIVVHYVDQDSSTEITLKKKKIINGKNFYFGTMGSRLLSNSRPREIIMVYNDKESNIYNDAILYDAKFWTRSRWNRDGTRVNSIYVVFDDDIASGDGISFFTKEVSKDISEICEIEKSKVCDKFNGAKVGSYKNLRTLY